MAQPNQPIQDAAKVITRTLLFKNILPLVISLAVTKAPFLGLKFINPIFAFIVEWLFNIFYAEEVLVLVFGITNLQVYFQKEEYQKASKEFANKINEKLQTGGLNDDDIKKASDEFDKRLGDLIHYGS